MLEGVLMWWVRTASGLVAYQTTLPFCKSNQVQSGNNEWWQEIIHNCTFEYRPHSSANVLALSTIFLTIVATAIIIKSNVTYLVKPYTMLVRAHILNYDWSIGYFTGQRISSFNWMESSQTYWVALSAPFSTSDNQVRQGVDAKMMKWENNIHS